MAGTYILLLPRQSFLCSIWVVRAMCSGPGRQGDLEAPQSGHLNCDMEDGNKTREGMGDSGDVDDKRFSAPVQVDEAKTARHTWLVCTITVATFFLSTSALCAGTQKWSTPGVLGSPDERAAANLHFVGFSNFVVFMFGQLSLGYISADSAFVTASVLPVGIAIMGCSCYFLIGLGASPVWVSAHRGILVYPLRNLTWSFTTSLMIFSVWYRSGVSKWRLASALALDWVMLGSGLLAAVSTGLPLYTWYFVSCTCFSGTFYEQWLMMGIMAGKSKDMPRSRLAVLRLRAGLAILWTTFGLTFAGQYFLPNSWMTWHTLEVLTIMADCGAKTVIAGAMGHGIVSTVMDLGIYKLEHLALKFVADIKANNQSHQTHLASMTHELRTPLNGIVALADSLILSEELDANACEVLQIIRDSGQRLGKLINNILDHASISQHKLTLVKQEVDMAQAVEDVTKLVSPILSPGVDLVVDIAPNTPTVDGDPVRIMQVLFNLLGNAAKFTESGTICVNVYPDEDIIKIEVKDTGQEPFLPAPSSSACTPWLFPPPPPPPTQSRGLARPLPTHCLGSGCGSPLVIPQALPSLPPPPPPPRAPPGCPI